MSRRMRPPESVRIPLTRGDWIEVKKHLTAGERNRVFARMVKTMVPGETPTINPLLVGASQAIEYLLDWSFEDAAGKPIVVRDKSPDVVEAALNGIDPESFQEVSEAIQKHDAEMASLREKEKNAPDGGTTSSATSPSAG